MWHPRILKEGGDSTMPWVFYPVLDVIWYSTAHCIAQVQYVE